MANLLTSTPKQNKTMSSVLKEGLENPDFFGPSTITLTPEEKLKNSAIAKKRLSAEQERQKIQEQAFAKKVSQYNDEIADNIPQEYINFIPAGSGMIVRYYYRYPRFQTGSLWRPGYDFTMYDDIKITFKGASGDRYTKSNTEKIISNPFKFAAKAVVIAVSKHCAFKPGDEVAISAPRVEVPDSDKLNLIYYNTWFVHPDTQQLAPTKELLDPHFGYGYVSEGSVLGTVQEGVFDFSEDKNK